jgi:hypothetical protein
VAAASTGMEVCLLGDFNIDLSRRREVGKLDFMEHECDLHQIVLENTRTTASSSSLIDHIYVSNPRFVAHVDVLTSSMSDHDLVVFSRRHKQMFKRNGGKWMSYRSMRNMDIAAFQADLAAQNLRECSLLEDVDEAWAEWYRRITSVLDRHAPIRRKLFRASAPEWLNGAVIDAMNVRDTSHRRAKRTGLAEDWEIYRVTRNDAKRLGRQAKSGYYNNIIQQTMSADPKNAWRKIKELLPKKQSVKTTALCYEGNTVNSKQEIASAFNEHFARTCSPIGDSDDIQRFERVVPNDVHFVMPPVDQGFVMTELRKLPNDKAVGFDGISGRVLKAAAPVIAISMTELFNLSLSVKQYPSQFKTAKVCALFKKGDKTKPTNYRPISVLPIASKLLERHVFNAVTKYLNDNDLMFSGQSGFRKGYGCNSALIKIMDAWLDNMESNFYTGVILIDFAKAFDSVHHVVLLNRLASYGIENSWFDSYLSARKQRVLFEGCLSQECEIRAGVPQGSVLGPLLFSVVINDMPSCLPNSTDASLYADDATLCVSNRDHTVVEQSLNGVAHAISQWTATNRMKINTDKTKVMCISTRKQETKLTVHMDGNKLEHVESARILGFELSSNPTNVDRMVKHQLGKARAALRTVQGASECVSPSTLKLMCSAFVRPHLIYCNAAWGAHANSSQTDRLNSVSVRCGKLCFGTRGLSREEYVATMGWLSHKFQTQFDIACEVYKSVNLKGPTYMYNKFVKSSVRTRSADDGKLIVPRAKTKGKQQSFSVLGATIWNGLPGDVRHAPTYAAFKSGAHKHFLNLDHL